MKDREGFKDRESFREALALLCIAGVDGLGPSVAMSEILATAACAAQATKYTPDEVHDALDGYFYQLATCMGEGQLLFPFKHAPEA